MSTADQLVRVGPYLGRLLEDEYIQDQIGQAITGLRRSSRRASGRSASEALKDRRLRGQLRDAIESLHEAALALQGTPARSKPRLAPRLMLLSAVGGAAALAWRARSSSNEQNT